MAANGVSRYTFSAVFPLFAVQSEFALFAMRCTVISNINLSVRGSWYWLGDLPSWLSRVTHATHSLGVF
jgi:hypothetical protein